jgi:hypothetical protein
MVVKLICGRWPTFLRKASKNDYTAYARDPEPSIMISEMEAPFLGSADYEQPPPYEPTPPVYKHLPSAPPLPI